MSGSEGRSVSRWTNLLENHFNSFFSAFFLRKKSIFSNLKIDFSTRLSLCKCFDKWLFAMTLLARGVVQELLQNHLQNSLKLHKRTTTRGLSSELCNIITTCEFACANANIFELYTIVTAFRITKLQHEPSENCTVIGGVDRNAIFLRVEIDEWCRLYVWCGNRPTNSNNCLCWPTRPRLGRFSRITKREKKQALS